MISVADRVEIFVLVDNTTDNLSSSPAGSKTSGRGSGSGHARAVREMPVLRRAWVVLCRYGLAWRHAAHPPLRYRARRIGVRAQCRTTRLRHGHVEGIVLSHGHWDHCGAMLRALDMIRARNGAQAVPTYMHPDMYRSRAVKAKSGAMLPMEDVPTVAMLEEHGARVVQSSEAQQVLDDLFFISGEIPRVTAFETGLPGHYRRTKDGSDWEPDPLLMDERFVAVQVKDKGAVVLTACSHAGVVNVMTHARDCFASTPLHGVLGGSISPAPTNASSLRR